MAITSRIVGISTMSWAGSARDGVLEVGVTVDVVARPGQAGNEAGPTTQTKVRYRVTGYVLTDNVALGLAVCNGATGILVAEGELVGGGTVTLTIGRSGGSGVVFTGTGDHEFDQAEGGGPASAIRIPFEGVFQKSDTRLDISGDDGLMSIVAS